MKFKRMISAALCGVTVLCLSACGNDKKPIENGNAAGTSQTDRSSATETASAQIADSDFEYRYDADRGGMVVTDCHLEGEEVIIPNTLDGEEVVGFDFRSARKKNFTRLVVPDTVQYIKFSDKIREQLEYVNIPKAMTEIEDSAFEECVNLKSINIPGNVKNIGQAAFANCVNLAEVTLGEGIESIRGVAFSGCSSIESIVIPKSIIFFGGFVFNGCTNLKSAAFPNDMNSDILAPLFEKCENIIVTYKGKTYDYAHIQDFYDAVNGR